MRFKYVMNKRCVVWTFIFLLPTSTTQRGVYFWRHQKVNIICLSNPEGSKRATPKNDIGILGEL